MRSVLSAKKMKSMAALLGKSLEDVAGEVGLGHGYIYRIGGKDTVSLNTINRIAQALKCSACDLIEEVEDKTETATAPKRPAAPKTKATQPGMGKVSDALRDKLKEELAEGVANLPSSGAEVLAREGDRRAMLIAQASQRIR
jgi:DNA-binding Xre family transcriptional regulator